MVVILHTIPNIALTDNFSEIVLITIRNMTNFEIPVYINCEYKLSVPKLLKN